MALVAGLERPKPRTQLRPTRSCQVLLGSLSYSTTHDAELFFPASTVASGITLSEQFLAACKVQPDLILGFQRHVPRRCIRNPNPSDQGKFGSNGVCRVGISDREAPGHASHLHLGEECTARITKLKGTTSLPSPQRRLPRFQLINISTDAPCRQMPWTCATAQRARASFASVWTQQPLPT